LKIDRHSPLDYQGKRSGVKVSGSIYDKQLIMERGHERFTPKESQELIRNPEQVFDSDVEKAQEGNRELMEKLLDREISREFRGATFETLEGGNGKPPEIRIGWTEEDAKSFLLCLKPISEGRGFESGVFGYVGSYGPAKQGKGYDKKYEFTDDGAVSLEDLFAVPEGIHLIIKPTRNRWAMESKNALTEGVFGKNARIMYMGLGFLLLGREWLHVGMHEAGHLSSHDENRAWSIANSNYAVRARPRKSDIKGGSFTGEFGLLKPQHDTPYGETPRLGDIARYGLVSHARSGGARIPAQWDIDDTMQDLARIIEASDEACEEAEF